MVNQGVQKGHSPTRPEDLPVINREQLLIITWYRRLHFKKRFIGGISERDVWKKIDELNAMYNQALLAERDRYDALLEQAAECTTNDMTTGVEGKGCAKRE